LLSAVWHEMPLTIALSKGRLLDEALGVLLALGDDRAVRATYVNGQIAFDRDAAL
jgi:hypothetical protein